MKDNERFAQALAMHNKTVGEDHETQKFTRGSRIKVNDVMPDTMWHFEAGFEAIINYSYRQKFGGTCTNHSYSLIQLDEQGSPINSIAWYYESQLTLVDDDTQKGHAIIEEYFQQNA